MNTLTREIERKRESTEKYVLANASLERMEATLSLMNWLPDAEDKAEFLLFVEAIDRNGIFSIKFLNLVVQLSDYDPVLKKAIELGIIQKK